MNKQQIINLAVAKISEMTVGINIRELERIITKVADLVEEQTLLNTEKLEANK